MYGVRRRAILACFLFGAGTRLVGAQGTNPDPQLAFADELKKRAELQLLRSNTAADPDAQKQIQFLAFHGSEVVYKKEGVGNNPRIASLDLDVRKLLATDNFNTLVDLAIRLGNNQRVTGSILESVKSILCPWYPFC